MSWPEVLHSGCSWTHVGSFEKSRCLDYSKWTKLESLEVGPRQKYLLYLPRLFQCAARDDSHCQEDYWCTVKTLPGGGNGTPLQYPCLENAMDGGAWWAAVHGVTKGWTWLKWLSSSSNKDFAREATLLELIRTLKLKQWVDFTKTNCWCQRAILLTTFTHSELIHVRWALSSSHLLSAQGYEQS